MLFTLSVVPEHPPPYLSIAFFTQSFAYRLIMPPPTASQKPNKAAAKESAASKAPAPAAASNGTSAATGSAEKHSTLTKPDQAKYNAEQDQINKEISELKVKQVSSTHPQGRQALTNRTLSSLESPCPKLQAVTTGEARSRPRWTVFGASRETSSRPVKRPLTR